MAKVQLDITVNDDGSVNVAKIANALNKADTSAEAARKSVFSFGGAVEQMAIGAARKVGELVTQGFMALGAAILRQITDLPALVGRMGEYAGSLLKIKETIGVTVEGQQLLTRAGNDVGVTFETQAGAIQKMQVNLAKTPDLVNRVGLEYDDLKNMAPERQFETIGKAIAGIEDPTLRTAMAVKIFGKSGTEVLPLFSGAIETARNDLQRFGTTMSEETARSIDRLSDNVELGQEAFVSLGRSIFGAIASSEPLQVAVEGVIDAIAFLSRTVVENQGEIRAWVSVGIVMALDGLLALMKTLGLAVDAYTGISIAIAGVIKMFKDQAAAAVFAANVMMSPISATKTLISSLAANQKELEDATASSMKTNNDWQSKLTKGAAAVAELTNKVELSSSAMATYSAGTKKQTALTGDFSSETDKAEKSAKRFKEALDNLARDDKKTWWDVWNTGLKDMETHVKAITSMASIDEILGAAGPNKTDWSNDPEMLKAIENGRRLAAEAAERDAEALNRINAEANKAAEGVKKLQEEQDKLAAWVDKWDAIGNAVASFGDILVEVGVGKMGAMVQKVGEGVIAGTRFGAAYKEAAMNGDAFGKAAAVATTAVYALQKGVLAGAAAGAQLGYQIGGPWGAAIGAAGGALLGWIGKAARAREEARKLAAEIEKSRSSFIAAAGGIDQLSAKATAAGYTLDKLFNAKTVKDYEAAVKELNDAFDLQKKAQEELTAAMEEFGIETSQLGEKFAQGRLDERAMDLLKKFELLKAAGVDLGVLYEKMGPKFNEYVQSVVAAGGTIPESLRPIIEQMIKLGILTDEAGNKITDINQLKFAPTMTEAIQAMTSAIKDLVNALLGIPKTTNFEINGSMKTSGGGSVPNENGGETTLPSFASGGIINAPLTGMDARLHGHEVIMPMRDVFGSFADTVAAKLSSSIARAAAPIAQQAQPTGPNVYYIALPDGKWARAFEKAQKRGDVRILPSAVQKF